MHIIIHCILISALVYFIILYYFFPRKLHEPKPSESKENSDSNLASSEATGASDVRTSSPEQRQESVDSRLLALEHHVEVLVYLLSQERRRAARGSALLATSPPETDSESETDADDSSLTPGDIRDSSPDSVGLGELLPLATQVDPDVETNNRPSTVDHSSLSQSIPSFHTVALPISQA